MACSDTAPVAETATVTASANTEKNVIVTDENFIRSDSNEQFAKYVKAFGAFSKFHHNRDLYDLNNQMRIGSINALIDGFATYWCCLQLVLNPDAWQFDRNLVAVAQDYSVIWAVAA